jgi:hypothetical protein
MAKVPDDIDLVRNGTRIAALTRGITLYTNKLFSTIPKSILACRDRYAALCPESEIKFYANENMTKHKPATRKTLALLDTWLKPGAPPREYVALEVQNGEKISEAPTFKFEVCGGEKTSVPYKAKHANFITMAFPPVWEPLNTSRLLALTQELCEAFPFQSGAVGFRFETSRYQETFAVRHAWAKSMRHPGIDICAPTQDKQAVNHDSVKGVNWLTILCEDFIEKVGGKKKLKSLSTDGVEIIDVHGGAILMAGDEPQLGDAFKGSTLPSYRAVHRALKKLIEPAIERFAAFALAKDSRANTEAWLRRFNGDA